MLNRLRHRLGYLTLLLLFLPSLVLTSVGEASAHGAMSMVGVESSHHESVQKGHGHTHGHEHDDGRHLSHESGSHFHEQADRLGANIAIAPNVRHAMRLGERRAFPLRRVYRLERPPRPVVA
ncbi:MULTISPECIES: hypothetical protein [Halomonadaceae]|jgi:hypothetical protein|uniref:Uncharacterized protein n=4 Tax=Vreelandella TaxID=3137766 RepID=A0A365TKB1_9GAMM|nr:MULTISPECIES: hypothetical protein [Halomonas]TDV87532.1 hypothetical protein BDK62_1354 [Halomonas alkaliantarctica]AJY52833.1 hypothetical protein KO116_P100076 [Halomonas sp. KO116]MDN3560464.1 hypothetical protein [Halomonas neptunia]NVF15430.1 hypothetical protein [Halomonas maris]NYS80350.1 hypothetical protein [Halomonas glaciei]|tara:strand:- start:26563 stop:26928 length:366 start_codon:yes stop_codon:yes gene_type:complete